VGSHLVDALVQAGAAVVVIDLPLARLWDEIPDGVERVMCDLRDEARIRAAVADADVVFHLAALASVPGSIESPVEYHEVNVDGTLTLLESVRRTAPRARVIFASSASVYGDHDVERALETLPAAPKSPYALHKYFCERMLVLWSELYGMETVSLRFFNIYGPRMNPEGPYAGVVGRFAHMRKEGKPLGITGDGTQTRDFVAVRDAVNAYLRAAVSPMVGKGEVINIAGGIAVSVNELAQLFGGPVEYLSPRVEIQHSLADISRAKSLLAWVPETALQDGVAEMKQQYAI
jgi:UDP-glucose 4-epimerase